ncbi:rCG35957 [Rattus norvegicus]|uniref:RCG35957 n=1 Tax=Rattus norvegicus TaxID=10116 RepID=A6IJS2_RAT|nr:rCG35957 [Rattus norvegicus]
MRMVNHPESAHPHIPEICCSGQRTHAIAYTHLSKSST